MQLLDQLFQISRLTLTRVAVYLNLDPVVATLLAALLLSEVLTGVFVLGFLAVLAGVLFINWPVRPRQVLLINERDAKRGTRITLT